jgi:glycosyltransferase involved in cell wall biosynthesis
VVQPDHGSFPEIIEATVGGVLFKNGDVKALADAMESLVRDPEQRRQLGTAGYRGVREKYTSQVMADAMWKLLEQLS